MAMHYKYRLQINNQYFEFRWTLEDAEKRQAELTANGFDVVIKPIGVRI